MAQYDERRYRGQEFVRALLPVHSRCLTYCCDGTVHFHNEIAQELSDRFLAPISIGIYMGIPLPQ